MSLALHQAVRLADERRKRRQRRSLVVGAAVAAALIVVLATFAVVRHFDRRYGPLEGGPFSGPYTDRGWVVENDGFTLHLSSARVATARLIAAIHNRGAHSVKITSIETGDMVTEIKWSAYRVKAGGGGSMTGLPTPWRTFPAIVPARGLIRLLITLHHPSNCSAYPKEGGVSTAAYLGYHTVHWESLLQDHASGVDVVSLGDYEGIPVC
jgi:hypothetical protein